MEKTDQSELGCGAVQSEDSDAGENVPGHDLRSPDFRQSPFLSHNSHLENNSDSWRTVRP